MNGSSAPICPACQIPTQLTTLGAVANVDAKKGQQPIWHCDGCGARVGCHPGTTVALGTPANAPLRAARAKVHAAFDPLWRSDKRRRDAAYAWLAAGLGLTAQQCHIGNFSLGDCEKALAFIAGHRAAFDRR
jgi:hypothetical protein